ncbi:MAG: replication initiation protein, partial [Acutalibacteraceae bacterium]
MDMTGGVYYSYVKKIIENIASYVIWLPMEDSKGKKSEYMTHWIQKARIVEDGTFSVQFDDDLKPYLFNLKSFYTMYNLEYVLGMRSKYGLRLYELLISHKNHAITIRFSLDELRERMDCENYKAYADFRIKALEPAIKDINDVSDIEVKYKAIKTGRSVSHIEFTMMYAVDDFLRHMERTVRLGYDKKD